MNSRSSMIAMALALSAMPAVAEKDGLTRKLTNPDDQPWLTGPTRRAQKLAAAQAKRNRKSAMRAAKAAQ